MRRFLTCLKVLAVPIVIGLSVNIEVLFLWSIKYLAKKLEVQHALVCLIDKVLPILKDLIWPLLVFAVACLFKDELIAILTELKRVVSRVREVNAGGVNVSFIDNENTQIKDVKAEYGEPVPKVTIDKEFAINDYCVKDAARSFGLSLLANAEVSKNGHKFNFPWIDTKNQRYKVMRVFRGQSVIKEINEFLGAVDEFLDKAKLARGDFYFYAYVVKEHGNDVKINSSDFEKFNVQVFFRVVALEDCIAESEGLK